MNKKQSGYLSYLLRLRRANNMGRPIWRISLEVPGSETQTYFDNLDTLCAFLAGQVQSIDEKGGSMDETQEEAET